jgi:ketosteroid isomerase-like protein
MSETVKQQIAQLEERRWTAMTQNDLPTLDTLFADDLVYTHSSGTVDSKDSYIQSMRSGDVRYKSVERDPANIAVHGDTAFVTGAARVAVNVRGQDKMIHMRYSNVWLKQAAGWRFSLWHATPAPKT